MAPAISILITVYNRERYLTACVESILASGFQDFEIIIVDDCSADNSVSIARNLASRDSRIQVHVNEQNLGDYGNRNKAAALASGTYLKYVDSDDLIYPHTLQVMIDAIERDSSIAVALTHSVSNELQPYPWILTPVEAYQKHFLQRGCMSCGPTGAIIRRSTFEQLGGFRKEWQVLADTDLWFQLAAQWKVALLPPALVWWRRHEGQEYTSDGADRTYLEKGFELTIQALKSGRCPLPNADRESALRRAHQFQARRLLALATRKRSPRVAWNAYRSSGLSLRELLGGLRKYST